MPTESRRMKVLQSCVAALMLLPSGTGLAAGVGPRAPPPPWRDPVGPPAQMDVWLTRLVGTHNVEGVVEVVYYPEHMCGPLPPDPEEEANPVHVPYCTDIEGRIDCVAIGTGPGVQCILNVAWLDMYETGGANLPGGVAWLSPAMGEQDVGGRRLQDCDRTIRIDARILHLSMDIEINDEMFTRFEMTLRRESQPQAPGAP